MAVVDRGGPWLAIWVNGNIRNLDQPAENYMQPYSMRRSGKTSALEDKQSSAMETKQNIGGAKPKWKTSTRAFLPSKNLGVCYILYDCTMVRWYNGTYQRKAEAPPAKVVQLNINGRQKTIVQQQLSLRGKKNDCMTATINGRQRRLRLCSPIHLYTTTSLQGKYCEMSRI